MSIRITGTYIGNKRVELKHPSGAVLRTAAPIDNNGDGSSFSPTDLVASGLGACMLTLIAIVGERNALHIENMNVSVEKIMSPEQPRRIAKLVVEIELPETLKAEDRKKLESAALTCPVHKSLHTEMEIPVTFRYV